jgi:hypothetical protein
MALMLLHLTATAASRAEARSGGSFGEWRRDAQALPSYVYTRDQLATAGSCSVPPSRSPDARHSTEHSFQLGNDRVVLVGNNYGSFRLRADEGGPKYLTGGWTRAGGGHVQFGGGFGHLVGASDGGNGSGRVPQDGGLLLSSYYSGGPRERQFGIGYARSTAQGGGAGGGAGSEGLSATHTVAVPVGDDPVVLLQVEVRRSRAGAGGAGNGGDHLEAARRLMWREVWGSLMMHLDPAWSHAANRSAFTESHYRSKWHLTHRAARNRSVIVHRRKWLGLTAAEVRHFKAGYPNPIPRGGSMWDEVPPSPFLAAVPGCGGGGSGGGNRHNMTTTMANDARSYFGGGTAAVPSERGKLVFDPAVREGDAALIAATSFDLAPGDSARLCYIHGYLQAGSVDQQEGELQRLIAKFTPALQAAEGIAANVSKAWKRVLPAVSMPSKPWLEDEMLWHAYYLRGGLTFDSYFREFILDQGTAYRYSFGFQGAIRDPLQHLLPMIEMAPEIAKSVLRYSLKEMLPSYHTLAADKIANLPYAIVGRGLIDIGGGGWKADPQVCMIWQYLHQSTVRILSIYLPHVMPVR